MIKKQSPNDLKIKVVKKQSSTDLKIKAVKYYRKINNYAEVCCVFGCSERSLKRWTERYKKKYS